MQELKEECQSFDPQLRETWIIKVDELSTELLINVEKKYRKYRTSEVEYSPGTNKARNVALLETNFKIQTN